MPYCAGCMIGPSIYLSISLSIYLSIYLSICLSVYLSVYLFICLSVCLSVHPSICLNNITVHEHIVLIQYSYFNCGPAVKHNDKPADTWIVICHLHKCWMFIYLKISHWLAPKSTTVADLYRCSGQRRSLIGALLFQASPSWHLIKWMSI